MAAARTRCNTQCLPKPLSDVRILPLTTTVEAIYENGILKLPSPLPLPEKTHVMVTIRSDGMSSGDSEHAAWLKLSEETLTKAWDNPGDDIFNELLQK